MSSVYKLKRVSYIYQFDVDVTLIAVYPSLKEAERVTGIADSTIGTAIYRRGICRDKWYFSREREFEPRLRIYNPVAGKRFTVTVTDEIWDRLLVAVGQRKKQDIFRNLLLEWLENEERKHDGKSN